MREMDTQKLTNLNASEAKPEALLDKINSKALGRIFLDSLDDARYGKLKAGTENSFAEGTNIYPPDVPDTLRRAQNYTIPKKPFLRNRDSLAFTTVGGKLGRTK